MKSVLAIALVVGSFHLNAQVVGKMFPEMLAETVEDEKVVIPEGTKGKYTLLCLAYSRKSENDLSTWFQPVFDTFIQQPGGLMAGLGYDVNVYFVPMFTGVNAAATGTAKKKAAKNIDPVLLPYVLFYKGELKSFREALEFEKSDVPYLFVLNEEGKIVFATTGPYSAGKMEQVEAVIE